jgi:PKHD-type hydroxylase
MLYEVFRLLSYAEADKIVRNLAGCTFVDGKYSAQGLAREVKNNLQLDPRETECGELDTTIQSSFQRNAAFQAFAMPKRILRPMFSRYEPGMEYGPHIDNSLMGGFSGARTDYSVTLFLMPPACYDGGELVIESSAGSEQIKLDAGEAIVYSSTSIHHVAPVTRGVRLAAVTWIQSAVRDAALRDILHDLKRSMKLATEAENSDLALLLGKSFHNLMRYAAEP